MKTALEAARLASAIAQIDLRACARNYAEDDSEKNGRLLERAAIRYTEALADERRAA